MGFEEEEEDVFDFENTSCYQPEFCLMEIGQSEQQPIEYVDLLTFSTVLHNRYDKVEIKHDLDGQKVFTLMLKRPRKAIEVTYKYKATHEETGVEIYECQHCLKVCDFYGKLL